MPTISDLKDQARALEQQGEVERALTIYQHILKHLEGTPAITKVLPLYVKAGDLLVRLERPDEAVPSYEAAAEQYAVSGASPRVVALCGKIIRLAPERAHVYVDFGRLLIEHGHVGSARDVLAAYADVANMDKALETLNDLAGRPNSEVLPLLERMLASFEEDEPSEHAAERVSSQIEQVTDDLAGELSGVPDEDEDTSEGVQEPDDAEEEEPVGEPDEESDEAETREPEEEEYGEPEVEIEDGTAEDEPLTPHLLNLDHMPQRTSLEMKRPEFVDEDEDEEGAEGATIEHAPELEITANVTPTMEHPTQGFGVADETGIEPGVEEEWEEKEEGEEGRQPQREEWEDTREGTVEAVAETDTDDKLDLLVADNFPTDDAVDEDDEQEAANDVESEEATDAADTLDSEAPEKLMIESSTWQPDLPEPSAEETVAAEWSPEEDLRPAARYTSEEYEAPDLGAEDSEQPVADFGDSAAIDEEIARAVEDSAKLTATPMTPEPPAGSEGLGTATVDTPPPSRPAEPPRRAMRRAMRRAPVTVPDDSGSASKQSILFGIGGFVLGVLAGAGLTLMFAGGDSESSAEADQVGQTAAEESPQTVSETPAAPALESEDLPQTTEAAVPETTADEMETAAAVDSGEAVLPTDASQDAPAGAAADTAGSNVGTEQDALLLTAVGNPIMVDGMEIEEVEEIEYRGLAGYRVVHLLDWADPIVIEAYRDTSVSLSTFVQVNVTPPDTVVGIRRLDGYIVYASGVMPEDSLRSLMTRLVEGESPEN